MLDQIRRREWRKQLTEIVILEAVFSVAGSIGIPCCNWFDPLLKCARRLDVRREGDAQRSEHVGEFKNVCRIFRLFPVAFARIWLYNADRKDFLGL